MNKLIEIIKSYQEHRKAKLERRRFIQKRNELFMIMTEPK